MAHLTAARIVSGAALAVVVGLASAPSAQAAPTVNRPSDSALAAPSAWTTCSRSASSHRRPRTPSARSPASFPGCRRPPPTPPASAACSSRRRRDCPNETHQDACHRVHDCRCGGHPLRRRSRRRRGAGIGPQQPGDRSRLLPLRAGRERKHLQRHAEHQLQPEHLPGHHRPDAPAGGGVTGEEIVRVQGTIQPHQVTSVIAECPPGKVVTGGGFSKSRALNVVDSNSGPGANRTLWFATGDNPTDSVEGLAVSAVCVDAAS